MSAIYNVDIGKLVQLLLPTFLRKPILIAFAKCSIYPMHYINKMFSDHRRKIAYKLEHTSQVCYLRAVLNNEFDSNKRRIKIADAPRYEHSIFYPREDDKAVTFRDRKEERPLLFHNRGLIGSEPVDFIVQIPTEILADKQTEIQLRSLVNAYKLASKRYILNTI